MDNRGIPTQQPMPPVMPLATQTKIDSTFKKDNSGLIKTIVIIILALVAVTFIGLFIWMFVQYSETREDVDGQIAVAVAAAKDEQAKADEEEFSEREKYPYNTFSGPADYGQLTFEYPRTWSVYVAADAANGGDFEAYFNPIQVNTVSKDTINALRLVIRNKSFDDVAAEYQRYLDRGNYNLKVGTITVNGTTANIYEGTIPNTDLNGYIVIFKIRDKTAVMQTDSVLFKTDFDKLIETVKFNA